MLERFLQLIGIHEDVLKHLDRAELLFQRIEVLWIGLVFLLPLAFVVYRRQKLNLHTVPKWLMATLCVTRVSILALMMLVLSAPYLRIDHKYEKKPIIALLFDHSQSMRLPAGPFETDAEFTDAARVMGYNLPEDGNIDPETRKALNRVTRADLAQTAVRVAHPELLKPLDGKFDVRHLAFARESTPFVFEPLKTDSQLPEIGGGVSSWIGGSIQQIIDDAAGQKDGVVNLVGRPFGKQGIAGGEFAGRFAARGGRRTIGLIGFFAKEGTPSLAQAQAGQQQHAWHDAHG